MRAMEILLDYQITKLNLRVLRIRRVRRGVIVNDPPAFRKFTHDQREDSCRIIFLALQMKFAENIRGIFGQHLDLQIRETELAHGSRIGITFAVALKDVRISSQNSAGADELGLFRVPISRHERGNIAAIPSRSLIVEHLTNRLLILLFRMTRFRHYGREEER